MSNPIFVDCPKNTWTKVATNVTTGQIHKKSEEPISYLHMYKLTGEAAPTDIADGITIFVDSELNEGISATDGIDVYIYALGEDGRVRVDL